MVRKILEQEPVTLSEVKSILQTEVKGKKDLGYVQGRAVSYSSKFAKLSVEDARKLVSDLMGLGLSKEKAVEIANVLPTNLDEVRMLLSKEKSIETEKANQILDTVKKYYAGN